MASSSRKLAEKEGAAVADLNTSVVAALKKAKEIDSDRRQDLIQDRVHPGPAGQLLMAEALLKAWNAPAVVSSVEIDAASGKVIKEENTKVDDLKVDGTISWTQLDSALPMPIDMKDAAIALAVKASDVEQALNQQTLKVSGLGCAEVLAQDRRREGRRADQGSARRGRESRGIRHADVPPGQGGARADAAAQRAPLPALAYRPSPQRAPRVSEPGEGDRGPRRSRSRHGRRAASQGEAGSSPV